MSVQEQHLSGLGALTPGTWTVDAGHSTIGFVVRHLVVAKVRGHFNEFAGTITIADDPLASKVEASVKAASIDTRDEGRDGHLRGGDFFDVENFPEWTLVSTGLTAKGSDYVLHADLTIKGITKSVVLDATLNKASEHPMKKVPAIGFDATATIKRSDFSVGLFAPMVGDEVTLRITTEATAPKADAAK